MLVFVMTVPKHAEAKSPRPGTRASTPAELEKRFKLRAVEPNSNTMAEMLMRAAQSSRSSCEEARLSSYSLLPAIIVQKG